MENLQKTFYTPQEFQSPFGDGRFLTVEEVGPITASQWYWFQSPFGDGRFLTIFSSSYGSSCGRSPVSIPFRRWPLSNAGKHFLLVFNDEPPDGFNPLSEMAAF